MKKQFKNNFLEPKLKVPRLKSNSSRANKHHGWKEIYTSRNVIVKFPSTNNREDSTWFFQMTDQKAEWHDFSKAKPESGKH